MVDVECVKFVKSAKIVRFDVLDLVERKIQLVQIFKWQQRLPRYIGQGISSNIQTKQVPAQFKITLLTRMNQGKH